MKLLTVLTLTFLLTSTLSAQEYLIDFQSSGIAPDIDTVIVRNITTGATIVLTGNDVLHLKSTVGKNEWESVYPNGSLTLFPNPMEDYSTLEFETPESGSVDVDLYNGTGLKLAQVQRTLPPGRHTYRVSGINTGIYLIRINVSGYVFVGKLVSNSTQTDRASLDYLNSVINENAASMLNISESMNSLDFKPGDKLLFTMKSGDYSTTITSIPEQDKSITGNFYDCIDMDNNIYPVVVIGSQVWMAANLKTTRFNDGSPIPNITSTEWANLSTPAYSWRKNDESFKDPYGALYNWYAVNNENLCPVGWHIPSVSEFKTLEKALGGRAVAGGALKETGTAHWDSPNTGATNSGGYTMLPGGYRAGEGATDFYELGRRGYLWSSTGWLDEAKANYWVFSKDATMTEQGISGMHTGFSVRCLLNNKGPEVNTAEASNITKTSATCQGIATCGSDSHISESGFCWGINPNPDITSNLIVGVRSPDGSFSAVLSLLKQNTVYFVRAYALVDGKTIYGNVISFRTLQESGKLTDFDGNEYKTVTIGSQTWMAENLKTTHLRNGVVIPEAKRAGDWITATSPAYSWRDNNREAYKNPYGALYNWYAVNNENLCPEGWHTPSVSDFKTLEKALGGRAVAGGALKETGTAHWDSPNTEATNSGGYTMLPGGYRTGEGAANFYELGRRGYLWSSTGWLNEAKANYWVFSKDAAKTEQGISGMHTGFSVRCLKNDFVPEVKLPELTTDTVTGITTVSARGKATIVTDGGATIITKGFCWSLDENPDTSDYTLTGTGEPTMILDVNDLLPNTTYHIRAFAINSAGVGYANELVFKTVEIIYGSVTDYEGNNYKTVQIGEQTWMAENLKTTKFSNGKSISNVTGDDYWSTITTPAYVWYNNHGDNKDIFGGYYNWYCVNQGNLCPVNWHVPTDDEWLTLVDYLGGDIVGGGKLRETGTTHWNAPNTGATDEVGFAGRGAGSRHYTGNFLFMGDAGYWWTSTNFDSTRAIANMVDHDFNHVFRNNYDKKTGMAVRCLRNKDIPGENIPEVVTDTVISVSKFSASIRGSLVKYGTGIIKRMGICWSTETDPDSLDMKQEVVPVSDLITGTITGLAPNTVYYVRCYAINSAGIGYGNVISLRTRHDGGNFITDIDGNEYDIVTIGTQTWMAENLKTTRYREGTSIPLARTDADWRKSSPGYCYYQDNLELYKTYGNLYNWYTVKEGNLCPAGWHVPAKSEFKVLVDYLGGSEVAGSKLKEAGTGHWNSPNTDAGNSTGFTALPGGNRVYSKKDESVYFVDLTELASFWSASETSSVQAWTMVLNNYQSNAWEGFSIFSKGNSVRCILGENLPPVTLPVISSDSVVSVTGSTSTGWSHITEYGDAPFTSRGFCWSTDPGPDTSDFRTDEGNLFGSYYSNITGLEPATKYYARAYATNSAGTAYGNEIVFETQGVPAGK